MADTATALGVEAVAIRSRAHVNDFLPMSKRDILSFEGCAKAWNDTEMASITLNDLSFVETHDCFTAELLEYEAMGLVRREKVLALYPKVYAKGWKVASKPSGGLKAKGHPIGATSVLRSHRYAGGGEAGEMQI